MLRFALRRVAAIVPLLIVISMALFVLSELLPGDPAVIAAGGQTATPEAIEAARERMGLNDPLPTRYVRWAADAVRGDLGRSSFAATDVTTAIADRLPVTISLTVVGLGFAFLLGVPAGVIAALRVNTRVDRLLTGGASLLVAVPPFVAGLFLVRFFAIERSWFPAIGYRSIAEGGYWGWFERLVLPGLALSMVSIGYLTRQTRSAFVDIMSRDFVRTARAKGLRAPAVVGKHMAKSAAIPIVTAFGLTVGRTLGGGVVVEAIFALPGFGNLIITAVNTGDINVLQGAVMVVAIMVLLVNLTVDLTYGFFDPKLRT